MDAIIGAGAPKGNGAQAAGDLIKNSSQAAFMADVVDGSREVPVIVDFWAPWCGPCKQLGPMLEKAVREAKGAVRMVKINVDEAQELAAQMRIQSIPAVYAFFQGRPVDGFQGALPESEVKAFVKRLQSAAGPDDAAAAVEEAMTQAEEALTQGDAGTAGAIFQQVLQHEPENMKALAGLLRAQIAAGEVAAAKEQFDALMALARRGIAELVQLQKLTVA